MNIWEDLTMSCPLCGAKPGEQCIGIQGSARFVIHEHRIEKNRMEYTRRVSLYPEMLAELKAIYAYLYGLRERIDSAEYGRLKLEYLIISDIIAECEEGENKDATEANSNKLL